MVNSSGVFRMTVPARLFLTEKVVVNVADTDPTAYVHRLTPSDIICDGRPASAEVIAPAKLRQVDFGAPPGRASRDVDLVVESEHDRFRGIL